jgi:hypothetical protein
MVKNIVLAANVRLIGTESNIKPILSTGSASLQMGRHGGLLVKRKEKMQDIEREILSLMKTAAVKNLDLFDYSLTESEVRLIEAAVSWTYNKIKETQVLNLTRLQESVTSK